MRLKKLPTKLFPNLPFAKGKEYKGYRKGYIDRSSLVGGVKKAIYYWRSKKEKEKDPRLYLWENCLRKAFKEELIDLREETMI